MFKRPKPGAQALDQSTLADVLSRLSRVDTVSGRRGMEPGPVLGDQPVEIMDEGRTRTERTGEVAGAAFDLENQIGAAADDATRARATARSAAVWPAKPNDDESDQRRAHAAAERHRSGPA